MLGADFATTLGFLGIAGPVGDVLSGIQLHGEVSHTWTADSEADDYVQHVVGLNYTFVDVIGEHDILLALDTPATSRPAPGAAPWPTWSSSTGSSRAR